MRKFIAFLLISCVVFYSCKKNNSCTIPDVTITASDAEIKAIQDSLEKYRLLAGTLQHRIGFFYKINDKGTGESVKDLCSTVVMKYSGSFFDGRTFDSSGDVPASMVLGQIIPGFSEALKLINAGGSMDIYIPPSLGYGSKGVLDANNNYLIPPNAYLVFHVELIEIK